MSSAKPLIQERVLLVGEGRIPQQEIERLSDEHMKIFLREPDPRKWPAEMAFLQQYLPAEERLKWKALTVAEQHESVVGEALDQWVRLAWHELRQDRLIVSAEVETTRVVDALLEYLRTRIESLIG